MTSKRLKYNRTNCPPAHRNTKDHKRQEGRNNSFRQEDKTVPYLLQQQRKVNRTMKAQEGTIIVLVKEGNSKQRSQQRPKNGFFRHNGKSTDFRTKNDIRSCFKDSKLTVIAWPLIVLVRGFLVITRQKQSPRAVVGLETNHSIIPAENLRTWWFSETFALEPDPTTAK